MTHARPTRSATATLRSGPEAAVVAAWRRLTGGGRGRDLERRTLLACSGGADSSALVLALASKVRWPGRVFVIAYVVHDLRPADEAMADLEAARALAQRLEVPFASAEVHARPAGGNLEAGARRLRYRALGALAREHNCPYVATAHHADDQLESVLMALLRGAGPRGLAGVAESRGLSTHCRLIRPMLGLTRADSRDICERAGHVWQEDATNADLSRLRGALRACVLPVLRELRPAAARHAATTARALHDSAVLLEAKARSLQTDDPKEATPNWSRDLLRTQPEVIVGEALRLAARSLRGLRGSDRLGSKQLLPAVRSIRSPATDPKVFRWSGLRLTVTARDVHMEVES